MSQSSSKTHGDDKLMTVARKNFLNSGHYKKLLDFIALKCYNRHSIVDIGCGEGYYTCGIASEIESSTYKVVGLDISKDIISAAATRTKDPNVIFAVANCSALPIEDSMADCIVSVFAPLSSSECARILKDDGIIIRVTPGVEHLIELKRAVYDVPQYNTKLDLSLDGFRSISEETLKYKFEVSNSQLMDLFTMTPYYYKTSPKDIKKLESISILEITAEFNISVYKKLTVN